MTRPRSRAPGLADPVYRRSRPLSAILMVLAVSACIGSSPPAAPQGSVGTLTASPASSPSTAPSSAASSAVTASPEPTLEPTSSAEPSEATSPEPSGSAAPGATVDLCTGNDDNRTFFAKAAASFRWPVYCAALPARWFVGAGSFSGASGGRLEITYKGPGGAGLELHEGAFCTDGTGCVPEGSDGGTVMFGDQPATLIHFEDGRVAAVVARGERLSWLAVGAEMSDETFRSILGALIRLD